MTQQLWQKKEVKNENQFFFPFLFCIAVRYWRRRGGGRLIMWRPWGGTNKIRFRSLDNKNAKAKKRFPWRTWALGRLLLHLCGVWTGGGGGAKTRSGVLASLLSRDGHQLRPHSPTCSTFLLNKCLKKNQTPRWFEPTRLRRCWRNDCDGSNTQRLCCSGKGETTNRTSQECRTERRQTSSTRLDCGKCSGDLRWPLEVVAAGGEPNFQMYLFERGWKERWGLFFLFCYSSLH